MCTGEAARCIHGVAHVHQARAEGVPANGVNRVTLQAGVEETGRILWATLLHQRCS